MLERNNYLIVANDEYVKYAKSLIYSLSIHDPKYYVYLYLINPSDNFKAIKRKIKNYQVECRVIKEKLDREKNRAKIVVYSEEGAYSANIRGKLLKTLVQEEEIDNLTYIDADSLVIKNLDRQQMCPPEIDITFFHRAEDTCSSGLISLNITPENKDLLVEMLSFYQERIEDEGIDRWFSDQTGLKDTFNKYIKTGMVKYQVLPKVYFDWTILKESTIWMGKGKKREKVGYQSLQKENEEKF